MGLPYPAKRWIGSWVAANENAVKDSMRECHVALPWDSKRLSSLAEGQDSRARPSGVL
jgi:hypothetical protein